MFHVIELNGVSAEATITDPSVNILAAYRVLYRQWRIAFEIRRESRAWVQSYDFGRFDQTDCELGIAEATRSVLSPACFIMANLRPANKPWLRQLATSNPASAAL